MRKILYMTQFKHGGDTASSLGDKSCGLKGEGRLSLFGNKHLGYGTTMCKDGGRWVSLGVALVF